MPSFIVKPTPDDDFYVRYSTVVDSVTHFGSRENLIRDLASYDHQEADPARFDRADRNGTSIHGGDEFGWDCSEFMIREGVCDPTEPDNGHIPFGYIQREDLRAFCATYHHGYFHPPAGMIRWEPIEGNDDDY